RNPGGVAALLLRDPHELPVVEADGMEGSSGVRLEEALEMAGDGFDVPMVGGATHVACRRPYGRLMLKQPLRNGVGDHPNVGVAGLLANHVGQRLGGYCHGVGNLDVADEVRPDFRILEAVVGVGVLWIDVPEVV